MDQHFSIDIAKYTKSNNILVGFNLYQPLVERSASYKKVIGSVVSHSEPQVKNGETYIDFFNVVLNSNKDAYRNAGTEEEREKYISVIETENINSYELATVKAALPKWSKPATVRISK